MARKIEVKPDTSDAPAAAPARPKRRLRLSLKRLFFVLLALALAAGIVYFAVRYNQARQEVKRLQNAQTAQADETTRIKNAVAKLVELPSNETPTLATVTDVT